MAWRCVTLNEWAEEHPTTNPFSECENISNLGGADLYYEELCYRYGERTLYNPDRFVKAIERLFDYNKYKYQRLLETTLLEYDVFNNYTIEKLGSESHALSNSRGKTGTDTRTLNLSKLRTDNLSESITQTPGVSTTVTNTPTVKTRETMTPTVKEQTVETPTIKTKETSI